MSIEIKTDLIVDDFGGFQPAQTTICQSQGIEEIIVEHIGYLHKLKVDGVLNYFSLRRNLDIVSTDDRSLTCITTGEHDSCPVCGGCLSYKHQITEPVQTPPIRNEWTEYV